MDLQENLQQVEANICKACENAGRKRSDVTLIAVSKTKPIEMLQTVYDLGARDFGENKVQEMCEKMEVLPKNIRWHMIGHLQTNKVKYIVGKTELIHSVDSLHLAKETDTPKDEGLQGNEKIEEAILELQKEPTPELLAHVLTVIRRRMKEGGQAILSVEPPSGDDQIRIGTVKSADGKVWWAAFTSFDEELKGSNSVKSTFLVSLEQLIHMASETKEISGVIFNPWNRTIMLDHTLLSIIIGEENAGH